MCGKYVTMNVWKKYAHIVMLPSRCPSLVKISDNALVVDQSARTVNINEGHTTSKLSGSGSSAVNGTKILKLLSPLERLKNWITPVAFASYLSTRVLTYIELTVNRGISLVTSLKCTRVVILDCIGEKGNGSRLFVA